LEYAPFLEDDDAVLVIWNDGGDLISVIGVYNDRVCRIPNGGIQNVGSIKRVSVDPTPKSRLPVLIKILRLSGGGLTVAVAVAPEPFPIMVTVGALE
jgi:hypothetical protein